MSDYDLGAAIGGVLVVIPTILIFLVLLSKERKNEKAYDNKRRELGIADD